MSRCAEAARPTGRVVILKGVESDAAPRAMAIEMVSVGGKHRTVAQLQELACEAGLELSAAGQQPSGYFVVECRPT